MKREELKSFILENYIAATDRPWQKYPSFEVFRHPGSGKWFALIMDLPRGRPGLSGFGTLDVVNLKCDPVLVASLQGGSGIFPAYHMNKENWLTVALDGSAPDDILRALLDMSYDLTRPKRRKK